MKHKFASKAITTWSELKRELSTFSNDWVFRGQSDSWELRSSLERVCAEHGDGIKNLREVEEQVIRDFRRNYSGHSQNMVIKDTLYCLALMQHYSGITRLLDWTYSYYVAAYFAFEDSTDSKDPIIWCLNGQWCRKMTTRIVGKKKIDQRDNDASRLNDKTFTDLYMSKTSKKFVFLENAFFSNERSRVQQGVFLCPGNINTSFEDNIKNLQGWESKDSIIILKCNLPKKERIQALEELYHMNISSTSLFPGLEGLARSYKTRVNFFNKEAVRRVGK